MDHKMKLLLMVLLLMAVLAGLLIWGLLLHGEPSKFFDWSRLYFAAGILAFLGFIFVIGMVLYALGPDAAPGKEIFDACVKVIPPIATLVIGFYFGAHQATSKASDTSASASIITRCVLAGFPGGVSRLNGTKTTGLLSQQPPGCLATLVARTKQAPPIFMLIVGRVDRRELIPKAREIYGSNFALAYQRALTVRGDLLESFALVEPGGKEHLAAGDLASRMVMLAGGPSYIDRSETADRCVEILGFWH